MAKAMNKQMEMFQDGGLEQDGGTIDPVSGNDVPVGSSQEEVRDDIPAQLSEGEFVFPADVVRFIGLEKLMIMRQEAKAGLKRMEDMGQMGNSEEATIPDDIPFSIDDLELVDEEVSASKGGAVKLQEGGMPEGVSFEEGQTINPAGLTIADPGMPIMPVQPKPISPTQEYKSPTVADVPVTEPTNPLPKFDVFVPPAADEYREYINDEGIIINVPYFRGNILPGYTLPVGFRLKETASEEEGITEDAILDITEPEGEDREKQDQLAKEAKENKERSYSNTVKKVMEENPKMTFQEVMDFIKGGNATVDIFGKKIKAPGFLFNEKDLEAAYNRNLDAYGDDFGESYSQLKPDEEERGYTFGDEADKRRAEAAAKKAAQEKAEAEAAAYQKSRLIAQQKAEEEFARKVAKEAAEKARVEKLLKEADEERARQKAIVDAANKRKASEAEKRKIAQEKTKRDSEAKQKRMQEAAARRAQDRKDAEEREKDNRDKEKASRDKPGSSCFSPMSEFKMADGTLKKIKDIKIGDVVELGGKVSMVMQGDGSTSKWYTYGSTKATSTHAVYENNNWTRVGTAEQSVFVDTVEPILITLVNENHRLVAKDGVVFTDYDEVDNTGIEDDLLLELNKS